MKKTSLLGVLILIASVLFLSGCVQISNLQVQLSANQLDHSDNDVANLTISFEENAYLRDAYNEYVINFFPGKNLAVYKNESEVSSDLIKTENGTFTGSYQIKIDSYIQGSSDVQQVAIRISSYDGKTTAQEVTGFIQLNN